MVSFNVSKQREKPVRWGTRELAHISAHQGFFPGWGRKNHTWITRLTFSSLKWSFFVSIYMLLLYRKMTVNGKVFIYTFTYIQHLVVLLHTDLTHHVTKPCVHTHTHTHTHTYTHKHTHTHAHALCRGNYIASEKVFGLCLVVTANRETASGEHCDPV